MPVYEYACEKCGHEFEASQRITDEPIKTCPKCKARKVKRLISQTSFVLKGGGWYSDLYSSGGKDKGGDKDKGEKSADSAATSTTETKSEAPATKPKDSGKGKGKKGKKSSKAAA
ncbi:MAG TPA: zinc ribbon domain-containing protein [Myxococcota bacterium]|nr:zinc ribbon domain-containing protein [Myxococcota bacterium]